MTNTSHLHEKRPRPWKSRPKMNILSLPDPLSKIGPFYLSPVKVLNDGQMETLFTLPLCLHGVVEKFSQWPIGPLQQLIVQQERVGSLYKTNYSTVLTNTKQNQPNKVHRSVKAPDEMHLLNG